MLAEAEKRRKRRKAGGGLDDSLEYYGLNAVIPELPPGQSHIDRWIWRHWKPEFEGITGKQRWEFMIAAMEHTWPEVCPNGRRGLIITPWTVERAMLWSDTRREYRFQAWWGPASTGKTTDAAALLLQTWWAMPLGTLILVCSSTLPAMKRRIWREVTRLFHLGKELDPNLPGEFRDSLNLISYDRSKVDAIQAVAILSGSWARTKSTLDGAHNTCVYFVIDEGQFLPVAVLESWANLETAEGDARFLVMGNPDQWDNALGEASRPIAGINSIELGRDRTWRTKRGVCVHFDGLNSPGIANPERYPFLLSQEAIEATRATFGERSRVFISQRRGWMPSDTQDAASVLSHKMADIYCVRREVKWDRVIQRILSVDPSFAAAGDEAAAVLVTFGHGFRSDGFVYPMVECLEEIVFPIEEKDGQPSSFALAEKIAHASRTWGAERVVLDVTAQQGAFGDILDQFLPRRCYPVNYGLAVSALPVVSGEKPANELFANKTTEGWMAVALGIRHGQVVNVGRRALEDFTSRRLEKHDARFQGKTILELKRDFRRRVGRSPNFGDALAGVMIYLRDEFGLVFGQRVGQISDMVSEFTRERFDHGLAKRLIRRRISPEDGLDIAETFRGQYETEWEIPELTL